MTAYHTEPGLALYPSVLACSTAKPKLSRSPTPMRVSVRNASDVMFNMRPMRITGLGHAAQQG